MSRSCFRPDLEFGERSNSRCFWALQRLLEMENGRGEASPATQLDIKHIFWANFKSLNHSPKLGHGITWIWQNISCAWNPKSSQRNAVPGRDGSGRDKVLNFCSISSNKIQLELRGKGTKRECGIAWWNLCLVCLGGTFLEFIKTSCCHSHTSVVLEQGCDLSHGVWKPNKTKLSISSTINSFNR